MNDNRPELLRKLDGDWIGKGQVMGDSVQTEKLIEYLNTLGLRHCFLI